MNDFIIGTIRENINLIFSNLHNLNDMIPRKLSHLKDLNGRWTVNDSGDIIPEEPNTLSIGSLTKSVKKIYVSQNSLHIVKANSDASVSSVKFGISEDNSLSVTEERYSSEEIIIDEKTEPIEIKPLTVPTKTQLLFSDNNNIIINALKNVNNITNSTNSIIINASSSPMTADNPGLYISSLSEKPENNLLDENIKPLYYDPDSKEILSSDGSGHFTNLNVSGIIKGPQELIIDPSPINDNAGVVRIKGNLIVDGTQTLINSNVVKIDDSIVSIKGSTQGSSGIEIKDEDNTLANFLYDGTNDKWKTGNKDLDIGTGKITVNEIISKSVGNLLFTQTISSGVTENILLSELIDSEDLQVGIFSISIIDSSGQTGSVGVYLMTKIFDNFFYTILIEKNIGHSELSFSSETGILSVIGDSSRDVSLEIKILNITKRDTV
jgi:hypothetical protein